MKKSFLQKWNCGVYLIVCLLVLNTLTSILGGILYVRLAFSFPNTSINDQQVQINTSELLVWYEEQMEAAKWEIVGSVSRENLEDTVSYLTQTIGERFPGTDNEKNAALWIQAELGEYGYEVEVQEFLLSNGLRSQNVIAQKRSEFVESTIVVGGHYDSVAASPGALDNATGVSGSLEIARVLSNFKTKCNIVYALFGSEECIDSSCSNSLQGSKYYVSNLDNRQKLNVYGMINLDMIAEDGEIQIRREAGLSDELANGIYEEFLDVGLKANVVQSSNWSDHESFEAARIPAVFIFTSGYELAHSPQDTIDEVHFERLVDITKGVVWMLLHKDCGL